jgi:two-component system, NtrC family, sensor histidine kinase HydH
MNRRLLLQITTPSVVIGLLLFGTCLVSVWYMHQLQTNLANVLSQNVRNLKSAQDLEIRVRQLRYHCFLYLIDPRPEHLKRIKEDNERFEEAMQVASEQSPRSEEAAEYVKRIQEGYLQYREELDQLVAHVGDGQTGKNYGKLIDSHPIRHVVDPCHDLVDLNQRLMKETSEETSRVGSQARWAMLLLGLMGPISGLTIGYGIARGISRSIYRLSVRVQDMAQRLDQDVASVSITADGDIRNLDKQLEHVVLRVEEVAERLQKHQREMLRAEQLSAVGQLAASVAHEVRNPLTSVKMLVEAALRGQNRKALSEADLKVIHNEIGRLEQTVQVFLDFARLPTPKRTVCDLREVITDALGLVKSRARHQKVELVWRCPENPVLENIDSGQIRTVFVNLFLNAFDAMSEGGCLEITLATSPVSGIRIDVLDSGDGILPEMESRLFTPFASSKPTGTGLGLSISRRIIEEHGGTLTGDNRPRGGACFTISLPAGQLSKVMAKEKFQKDLAKA